MLELKLAHFVLHSISSTFIRAFNTSPIYKAYPSHALVCPRSWSTSLGDVPYLTTCCTQHVLWGSSLLRLSTPISAIIQSIYAPSLFLNLLNNYFFMVIPFPLVAVSTQAVIVSANVYIVATVIIYGTASVISMAFIVTSALFIW